MSDREFKVKDFAEREQVTTRTVRSWIAKGALEVRRTIGGHLRIIDRRSEARSAVVISVKDAEESGKPAG